MLRSGEAQTAWKRSDGTRRGTAQVRRPTTRPRPGLLRVVSVGQNPRGTRRPRQAVLSASVPGHSWIPPQPDPRRGVGSKLTAGIRPGHSGSVMRSRDIARRDVKVLASIMAGLTVMVIPLSLYVWHRTRRVATSSAVRNPAGHGGEAWPACRCDLQA